METFLLIASIAGGITTIVGAAKLIAKPIRKRSTRLRKQKEGDLCLLRAEMLRTYYHNEERKSIRQFEMENFVMMYDVYKELGGNSFIDIVHEEVSSWEVVT